MEGVRRMFYFVGKLLRETGQSLDHLGIRVQGGYHYREPLSRHRQIMNIEQKKPVFEENVFLAPNASLIGNVQVGRGASIWYGAVLRADAVPIVVGEDTHIGEGVVIHCTRNPEERGNPTVVGKRVMVAPLCTIYSATIFDEVYIGLGTVIETDCIIASHSVITSGSRVCKGTEIPPGELWGGNPASYIRKLTKEEVNSFERLSKDYQRLAILHAQVCGKTPEQVESEKHMSTFRSRLAVDYLEYIRNLDPSKRIALPSYHQA
eukprot:jgi/Galph1/1807/GphlegSOOS_G478.1